MVGTIPTEFGQLTGLLDLWLNDNYLTGTVPTELRKLTSLLIVYLENNGFTGTLPMEFSQWSNVREFLFSGNNTTGSVDDVFCSGDQLFKLLETLQSDCLAAATMNSSEIECQCCTVCCNSNGEDCRAM